MTDDQRAAIERLRRFNHEIMQGTVVDCQRVDCEGVDEARQIVADLYLAENPADGPSAADELREARRLLKVAREFMAGDAVRWFRDDVDSFLARTTRFEK